MNSISHEMEKTLRSIIKQIKDFTEEAYNDLESKKSELDLSNGQIKEIENEIDRHIASIKERLEGLYGNMRKEINALAYDDLIRTSNTFYNMHNNNLSKISLYGFNHDFKMNKIHSLNDIEKIAKKIKKDREEVQRLSS